MPVFGTYMCISSPYMRIIGAYMRVICSYMQVFRSCNCIFRTYMSSEFIKTVWRIVAKNVGPFEAINYDPNIKVKYEN